MRPTNRAVSTVVDVSLALLLVTASIATMVVFLGDDDPEPGTRTPEELAQTLAATTRPRTSRRGGSGRIARSTGAAAHRCTWTSTGRTRRSSSGSAGTGSRTRSA